MNNDKQLFARISLGLFLAAMLVPFLIAALGREDLAGAFALVSALLALVFAWQSRTETVGRIVLALTGWLLALLVIYIAVVFPITYARRVHELRAQAAAIEAREAASLLRKK